MVDNDLFTHTETDDPSAASVTVDAGVRADHAVEPYLYGKFCEHLGNNVYQGMEAEILFNPTFGEWHFRASNPRQSGGFVGENDPERIADVVADHGRPLAYPEETDDETLLDAYRDGLAFGWVPTDEAVTCSPDTGPAGNRAQRFEFGEIGASEADPGEARPSETDPGEREAGVTQETRLPLHRTRGYEFRCQVRAADPTPMRVTLAPTDGDALAEATFEARREWTIVEGTLDLPADGDLDEDGVFEVSLFAEAPANVVVECLLLYPDDHVDHADPEVVRFLRESDLPLLRWPGGNFVSGYDWRDGVGPVDERPERTNPAWHGLEPNLFGTDEFVQFCERVGCEPSICVNAGDGTPEEAAAWVEYCNGSTDTEMGALRAEHGHPEPYDVTYWEIGNELYGRWQVNWTTPAGNADRYERFREAMLDADPSIEVTACGLETNGDGRWNDVLLERAGSDVRAVSDHILAGGRVDGSTDRDELYHAFMGFSEQLGETYRNLRDRMAAAGVADPKLDITELQLFAHFRGDAEDGPEDNGADESERLTAETMPTPTTISEALYDATIRHECIRMGEFVEMLTHSATVNHGGGLWKRGERVWANPCHYGRSMGSAQAGGIPVGVEVACDTVSTETAFREIDPIDGAPALDVMATVSDDESELVAMFVNRTADETLSVSLDVDGFDAAGEAEVTTLSGETMYDENSRHEPERVAPESSALAVDGGQATLDLPPHSLLRLTLPAAD